MNADTANIKIPVDLTNPGQFFACCGLLELADRLWPGAEGWFEGTSFTEMRRLILAVCQRDASDDVPLPSEASTDLDEWTWLLEGIEERIFWDADFEMGDEFLDLPPEEARHQLETMGISPDYYLTVPDEPNAFDMNVARQTLRDLLAMGVSTP